MLCNAFKNEHVWMWVSGDTIGTPYVGQKCTCGAYKYQGAGKPAIPVDEESEAIQNAAAQDFLSFEAK